MGNVIAGFVGGIVSYGIGHIQSIAPWKVRKKKHRTIIINPLTNLPGCFPSFRSSHVVMVGYRVHLPSRHSHGGPVPQRTRPREGRRADPREQDWNKEQCLEAAASHRGHFGRQDMAVGINSAIDECRKWRCTKRRSTARNRVPIFLTHKHN